MPAIIILGFWRFTGINALYFMAGLQNIPEEVREAAMIDGANRWQVFRYITLPLLRPVMIFVLTFAIIGSYNLFGEPASWLGAEGGPSNAGLFMTMYLYLTGFRFLKFGYASAIGYALADHHSGPYADPTARDGRLPGGLTWLAQLRRKQHGGHA